MGNPEYVVELRAGLLKGDEPDAATKVRFHSAFSNGIVHCRSNVPPEQARRSPRSSIKNHANNAKRAEDTDHSAYFRHGGGRQAPQCFA